MNSKATGSLDKTTQQPASSVTATIARADTEPLRCDWCQTDYSDRCVFSFAFLQLDLMIICLYVYDSSSKFLYHYESCKAKHMVGQPGWESKGFQWVLDKQNARGFTPYNQH